MPLIAQHRLRRLLQGEVRSGTNQTPNMKLRSSERSTQAMLLGSTVQLQRGTVEELHVVCSKAMDKALENFEEACDEDTPLTFRALMAS